MYRAWGLQPYLPCVSLQAGGRFAQSSKAGDVIRASFFEQGTIG
jgi:hypothetical protein